MYRDPFTTIYPEPILCISDGQPISELGGKKLPAGALYHRFPDGKFLIVQIPYSSSLNEAGLELLLKNLGLRLPYYIMKKLPLIFSRVVAILINNCINNAYFPKEWKKRFNMPSTITCTITCYL